MFPWGEMPDAAVVFHVFARCLWRLKVEILSLLKSVAENSDFIRLRTLVCSPPLERQVEWCERLKDLTCILLMILPESMYRYYPTGDLKFPMGYQL